MPKISVLICCMNAQDTIEGACRSAEWADELVVVDSGSTDQTPEIARRFADCFETEPWRGYSAQKQYGTSLCRNEWVFVLDADEEVSEQLRTEIQSLDESAFKSNDVFLMRRRNWVMGRIVRAWWPDWQSRLIRRDHVDWPTEALHEARIARDPGRTGRLTGWLEHKRLSEAGFSDYFSGRRMDERLMMVAWQMHERGKRAGFFDLWLRPLAAFFKFYVLKAGFLDGSFGLMIAQKAASSTQLRYAALWAVQQQRQRSSSGARDSGPMIS